MQIERNSPQEESLEQKVIHFNQKIGHLHKGSVFFYSISSLILFFLSYTCFLIYLPFPLIVSFLWLFSLGMFLFYKFFPKKRKCLDSKNLFLHLDIKNPDLDLRSKAWHVSVDEALCLVVKKEKKLFQNHGFILMFFLVTSGFLYQKSFFTFYKQILDTNTAQVSILKGQATLQQSFDLLTLKEPIKLIYPNLIELSISNVFSRSEEAPAVVLRDESGKELQTFRMVVVEKKHKFSDFKLVFSVDQTSQLYIPEVFKEKILASLHVEKEQVPEVDLVLLNEKKELFHEEETVSFRLKVFSKNSLDQVNLMVKKGSTEKKEKVLEEPLAQNTLDQTHDLALSDYADDDIVEIEIQAEVIDQSKPSPKIGYSNVITLKVGSAYGRYKKTLGTLKEIKDELSKNVEQSEEVSKETSQKMDVAIVESNDTPFFDGLDRFKLFSMKKNIDNLKNKDHFDEVYDLLDDLGGFLAEHEMLDDRERDWDFFVAARTLSKMIEIDKKESVTAFAAQVKRFVEERQKRWSMRVAHYKLDALSMWEKITKENLFTKPLDEIVSLYAALDSKDRKNKSLNKVSELSKNYKSWLEELEKSEDQKREQQSKEQKEQMVSIVEELKALQKAQGEISQYLDKAHEQPKEKLESAWAVNRLKQNSNILKTNQVRNKLKSMGSPIAARIDAASQTMTKTIEAGEKQEFVIAESASDYSGRLLRQALKSSSEESSGQKPRRRKRVSGDSYYGQALQGGDIEFLHDYQVDPKYRKEILDEVQNSSYDNSDRALLDNYLRKVIR